MCKNKTWKMEGDGGGIVTAGNIKRDINWRPQKYST